MRSLWLAKRTPGQKRTVDTATFACSAIINKNLPPLLPPPMQQVQHYILVVQAQDNGHPSLSTTLTVYCNVLDLNDNAPVFDPMSYSNEVLENVPVGTEVVSVSATDVDSGEFAAVAVLIMRSNNSPFRAAQSQYLPVRVHTHL